MAWVVRVERFDDALLPNTLSTTTTITITTVPTPVYQLKRTTTIIPTTTTTITIKGTITTAALNELEFPVEINIYSLRSTKKIHMFVLRQSA